MYPNRIVAPLLLLLALVACTKSKESLLEEGNRRFEEKKFAEASIEFRKALQKDQNYGEALYRLALSELRQGKMQEAFVALNQAARVMPSRKEVQADLGDFALGVYLRDPGRPEALYKLLNEVAGRLEKLDANSFEAFRIRGYLAAADRKPADSLTFFRKAESAKPGQADVVTAIAQTLFATQQAAEAEKVALAGISVNKTHAPLYDLLYGYYRQSNRPSDGESLLKSKVENNPSDPVTVIQMALHSLSQNKPADAEAWIARLTSDGQRYPDGKLLAGDYYARLGDWPRAIQTYQSGIDANPKNKADYQRRVVTALVVQRKSEEASRILDDLLKANPNDVEAQASRALLRIGEGDPAELDRAIAAFQKLVQEKPEDVRFRYELGWAQRLRGRTSEAQETLREVIRRNENHFLALEALAEIAIERGRPQEAGGYADQILKASPEDPRGQLLKANTLLAQDRSGEARPIASKLVSSFPGLSEARLALARVDIAQKRFGEAESALQKLAASAPQDARVLQARAEARLQQGKSADAIALVDNALKADPQSTAIRNLRASLNARTGNVDAAIAAYREISASRPEEAGPQFELGLLYQMKGDFVAAADCLAKAVSRDPKNPRAHAQMGAALDQCGKSREAEAAYRASIALDSQDPVVLNNLAYLLSRNDETLGEAQKFSQLAVQLAPDFPSFTDTLAWIYLRQKKTEQALRMLQPLAAKYPASATFRYHYGAALLQNGEKVRGKSELQAALQFKPDPNEEREIRALLRN